MCQLISWILTAALLVVCNQETINPINALQIATSMSETSPNDLPSSSSSVSSSASNLNDQQSLPLPYNEFIIRNIKRGVYFKFIFDYF